MTDSPYQSLYTLGYTGVPIAALQDGLEELDALLVDIRYSPFSRAPMWQKRSMRGRFGDWPTGRYLHLPSLGNVNYKTPEKGIQIKDMDAGLEVVQAVLRKKPVILLCACPDPAHCHRRTVAEEAQDRFHLPKVIHLLKEVFKPGVNLKTLGYEPIQESFL